MSEPTSETVPRPLVDATCLSPEELYELVREAMRLPYVPGYGEETIPNREESA